MEYSDVFRRPRTCDESSAPGKRANRLVDFCTGELTGFANQDLSKFCDIIVTGQELSWNPKKCGRGVWSTWISRE